MTDPALARVRDLAGTVTLRDGRIVYASEGLAALVGERVAGIIGQPFLEFVVTEERALVAERYERRRRGEAVPPRYEITLALPGRVRRRVEVHVDVDGADVLVHVRDIALREAHRLRLDAVASLGAALQRELSEERIFARLRDDLGALGLSSLLLRAEPAGIRVAWASVLPSLVAGFHEVTGVPLEGFVGRWSDFSRRVYAEGSAFSEDWALDVSRFLPEEHAALVRAEVSRAGLYRAVGVRLGEKDDADQYLVVAGEWLGSEDTPALRLLATQLAAALAAARTIADLSRRNADLAALNRVAELAGEAGDLGTFLARTSEVLRSATGCAGTAVFVLDEAAGELVRAWADDAPGVERFARFALTSPLGQVVGGPPGVLDTRDAGAPEIQRLGFGAVARVPLVARSRTVGVLAAGFRGGAADARGRLGLLTAVGAHVAAAVESHGLLSDLLRRVDELTLLNDVALATARLEPSALLDAVVRRVCETLGADVGSAYVREGDRLVLAAEAGMDAECARAVATLPVGEGAPGLAVARREPILSDGVDAYAGRCPRIGPCGKVGALVAVPLLATADAVGVLVFARGDPREFGTAEVRLLSAIGVQLGLGLENARLYADARRRVEELSLLNEVGRAITASLDLEHVLREGAEAARRLVGGSRAAVTLYDPVRSELRYVGMPPAELDGLTFPLAERSVSAEVVRERRPMVIDDARRHPLVHATLGRVFEPRSLLAAPLLLRGEPLGALLVEERERARPFSAADLERVTAVANPLAVAIENARLYSETRRRAEELGLLHEVGRSLVETLDIQQLLQRGVQNLARMVDAPSASLLLATPAGDALEVRAVAGTHDVHVGLRLPLEPPESSLAAWVVHRREPVGVEDGASDPRVNAALQQQTGARGYLGLPLLVRERIIGAVIIMEPRAPRRFTQAEVERAAAIANQLAVAVENARLYEDLRHSYAELERAQHRLVQRERLAALGELAAVVAHEVRNPLGVIFNSLGSLRRLVRPTGDAKLLLDIVGEEADRLNRIVGDLLDFARPSTPELRPGRLEQVVEEAVSAALSQCQTPVEVVRELAPDVPAVAIDARLVWQAVVNVAVNAVQAMPRGGRLTVRTRRGQDAVLLEIEDSGPGIPAEVSARIFEPFFTTKASGTGLGLAVVKRIVEGHGGTVAVTNRPGAGAVFALSFPLAIENRPALG